MPTAEVWQQSVSEHSFYVSCVCLKPLCAYTGATCLIHNMSAAVQRLCCFNDECWLWGQPPKFDTKYVSQLNFLDRARFVCVSVFLENEKWNKNLLRYITSGFYLIWAAWDVIRCDTWHVVLFQGLHIYRGLITCHTATVGDVFVDIYGNIIVMP